MDKNYLKFWGNLFNQAAENQERIEEMTKWLNAGMKGSSAFMDMFKDFMNTGMAPEKKPDTLDEAALFKELQKSFDAFLSMFGVVPQSEYLSLVKKYEGLKKTVADQKETIEHLRVLLDEKQGEGTGSIKAFQEMAETQAQQFASLMNSFGGLYQKKESDGKDKE